MIMNIKTDGYSLEVKIETKGYSDVELQTIATDLDFYFDELHVYFEEYKRQRKKYVDACNSDNASKDVLQNLKDIYSVYASSVCRFLACIENIILQEKEI